MLANPFSPVFGGKPDLFFGRSEILTGFSAALVDKGSEDRVLFITGARGLGKTVLLEQLSRRAAQRGWQAIDLGPEHVVDKLVRRLRRPDEETKTVAPQLSVSLLGAGGSVGGISTSKTTRMECADLELLFLEACERRERIFVTIDEIQKVPLEDVSEICNAFQMASRKGHDVMLAVAGLPHAYDQVIRHEGSTYMRRASAVELGLLSWEEVLEAFRNAFSQMQGLSVPDEVLVLLVEKSLGHPYLVQLLGFYLVQELNACSVRLPHAVCSGDVEAACEMAYDAFRRRAVKPIVEELSRSERDFLVAMTHVMDDERVARIDSVMAELGKKSGQISPLRARLVGTGVIIAVGRGELMFNVPLLADYLRVGEQADENVRRVRAWRL